MSAGPSPPRCARRPSADAPRGELACERVYHIPEHPTTVPQTLSWSVGDTTTIAFALEQDGKAQQPTKLDNPYPIDTAVATGNTAGSARFKVSLHSGAH